MKIKVLIIGLSSLLYACNEACDPYYSPAMVIEVFDSNTNEKLCGLSATAQLNDDIYEAVDSTEGSCDGVRIEPPVSSAGTYLVTVKKNGYETWQGEVQVEKISNDCHVYTENVVVNLVKE